MTVKRRDVLIGASGAVAGIGSLLGSRAAVASELKELAFHHIHTGEDLRLVYAEGGEPIDDALAAIDYLLRDFRTGDVHPIDTNLLDILSALYEQFDRRGSFEVISGYRTPKTNATLRTASSGVAKKSLHLSGRAIDVRLTSASTADLREAAVAMASGGVGYYPKSDFAHIDTGRVRTW